MSTHAHNDAESSSTHQIAAVLRHGWGVPARSVEDQVAGPVVVIDSRFGTVVVRPDLVGRAVVVRRTDTTDWVLRTDGTVHDTAAMVVASVPELARVGDVRVWLVAHASADPATVVWAGMDPAPEQACHHCASDGLTDTASCPGLWSHMRQAAAAYQGPAIPLVFGAFPVTEAVPPGDEIPLPLLHDVMRQPATLVRAGTLTIA